MKIATWFEKEWMFPKRWSPRDFPGKLADLGLTWYEDADLSKMKTLTNHGAEISLQRCSSPRDVSHPFHWVNRIGKHDFEQCEKAAAVAACVVADSPSSSSPSSAFMKFMEIELEKIKKTGILPDYVIIGKPPKSACDTPETESRWESLCLSGTPWSYKAEQMLEACEDMEFERNEAKAQRDQMEAALMLAARWGISSDGYSAEVASRIRCWIIGGMQGEAPKAPDYYPSNARTEGPPTETSTETNQ